MPKDRFLLLKKKLKKTYLEIAFVVIVATKQKKKTLFNAQRSFFIIKKKTQKNLPGDSICCNSCYNTKIFQKKRRL